MAITPEISNCYIYSLNRTSSPIPQSVTLASVGYATFYSSESAYTLPNGLSAQVVTGVSNGKLTYKTIADGSVNGVVPKGTAVMLVSDNLRAGSYTLTPSNATTAYSGTNLLRLLPPLCLTKADADEFLSKLKRVLNNV